MEAEYIRIEPFVFKYILAAEFEKGFNDHYGARIKGYIRQSDEAEYSSAPLSATPVIARAVSEEGEEKIIYYGILAELHITCQNSQLLMEIFVVPYTKLMDLQRRCHSFQNGQLTYNDVLRQVSSPYQNAGMIVNPKLSGIPIGDLIVQYQETDWEFIKRLASHFHTVVMPDYLTDGEKFYFGLPGRNVRGEMDAIEYRLEKSLISYQYKTANEVSGTSEYDDMAVIITSRVIHETGNKVLFEGRPYVVSHSLSKLDGHQLTHTYTLTTENGMSIPKGYSEKIIGASIDGFVEDIKTDVVKVRLGIDNEAASRWFPFATVFSSPDGSGWYCMPQKGDEVRLYFPTRSEKHAYVVSSVHRAVSKSAGGLSAVGSKGGGIRSNPYDNELRTPDKKVVRFTENSILMENDKGLSIEMIDYDGIYIRSNGKVSIDASGDLNIIGSDVMLTAQNKISLESAGGAASVILEGDTVSLHGTNVKIQ